MGQPLVKHKRPSSRGMPQNVEPDTSKFGLVVQLPRLVHPNVQLKVKTTLTPGIRSSDTGGITWRPPSLVYAGQPHWDDQKLADDDH